MVGSWDLTSFYRLKSVLYILVDMIYVFRYLSNLIITYSGSFECSKLTDRITQQVNFFPQAETQIEAGPGGNERPRRWWRIEKFKKICKQNASIASTKFLFLSNMQKHFSIDSAKFLSDMRKVSSQIRPKRQTRNR